MIRDFLRQARELDELKRQFPDAAIQLTGLGFYAPVLTAAQWERHYGAGGGLPCVADALECQGAVAAPRQPHGPGTPRAAHADGEARADRG